MRRADVPVFRDSVGCEFEVLGNNASQLDYLLQDANLTTAPPLQLSATDAARLHWGLPFALPHKGGDAGRWRVVPELAFPLDSHEIISPALTYANISQIRGAASSLSGLSMPGDAAFHVHVGHAEVDALAVTQLVQLWASQQEMLYALANTSLRQRQLYARPLEALFLQALQEQRPASKEEIYAIYRKTHRPIAYSSLGDHAQRFYGLNLHYLHHGQTLEFRPYEFTNSITADGAQAFVDLSLSLVAAARNGHAAALGRLSLNATSVDDAAVFLDALGLTRQHFPKSRVALLANLAGGHGFAFFAREKLDASVEAITAGVAFGILNVGPPTFGPRWLGRGLGLAVGLWAESVFLASALHLTFLQTEAWGATTYAHTYASREWTALTFAQIGLARRAVWG